MRREASAFGGGIGGGVGRGLRGVGFRGLGHAGEVEVLFHGELGLRRVVGADGAVNFAVQLGGLFQVLGVFDGEAAVVVEVGGDGLHQRAQDRVARGAGDSAVEADVMDEVLVGVARS